MTLDQDPTRHPDYDGVPYVFLRIDPDGGQVKEKVIEGYIHLCNQDLQPVSMLVSSEIYNHLEDIFQIEPDDQWLWGMEVTVLDRVPRSLCVMTSDIDQFWLPDPLAP